MRWPKSLPWVVGTVICLVGSLELPGIFAQPAPSGSGQEIAAGLFAQPRPILEEALGYPLSSPPRFRSVSAAELQQSADPELEAQLRWQYSGLADATRKQALEATRDAFRAVSVSLYRSGTDILLPANSPRLAEWAASQTPPGGNPAAFRKDFVTLALVLEAARMALDQHYHLSKRWSECRSRDDFEVLEALYEGQALWVTRRVARRLGLDNCFPLLIDRLDCVLRQPSDPSFDDKASRAALSDRELYTVCWLTLCARHQAAIYGLGFFDYLEKQGVAGAADRAFSKLPPKLNWVEHPELYCKAEFQAPGNLVQVLDRLGDKLKNQSWDCHVLPWTPEMVREVAANLGTQDQAERVLRSWRDGAALLCGKAAAPGELALGVVRLTDDAGARAYFGLSADMQRQQDELLNTRPNSPQRVARSETHTLPLPGTDEAVQTDKEFKETATGQPSHVTTLLVRASNLVVLFTWRELPPDPDWAGRLLGDLRDSCSGH